MTQFSPPPYPNPGVAPVYEPPRWSGSAIAAFVCSVVGCTGIGAILGLILAAVGIMDTRGGRRKGRGLAIAAIPISILMGGICGLAVYFVAILGHVMAVIPMDLKDALAQAETDTPAAVSSIRRLTSPSFNDSVSDDALSGWLKNVEEKHGTLNELEQDQQRPVNVTPQGVWQLQFKGKFVNGPATIKLTLGQGGLRKMKLLDDVEIDGVSPKAAK